MWWTQKTAPVADQAMVIQLINIVLRDETLSNPVYLAEIKSEQDAHQLGSLPVIYVWNENSAAGSFTVSVNGNAVSALLQTLLPRDDPQFELIRDEGMAILLQVCNSSVLSTCEKLAALPSDLFTRTTPPT